MIRSNVIWVCAFDDEGVWYPAVEITETHQGDGWELYAALQGYEQWMTVWAGTDKWSDCPKNWTIGR